MASPFSLLLPGRTWACDWCGFQPVRDFIRSPALDIERQHGCKGHTKIDLATGAVDEHANAYQLRAVCIYELDALVDTSAGRQDVIDDEYALASFHMLWAAEEPLSIRALLSVSRGCTKVSCDFIGEDDAKRGWAEDNIGFDCCTVFSECAPKLLNILRIAEYMELLEVAIGVTTTGQHEVTGQQGAGFFKEGKGFGFSHSTLIVPMSGFARRYT